ncbi:MAG: hypothetical protein J3K34DRAFT_510809 [Monoraphidium minutum]|nr:MAG: hypothetical protein J3K34DRAFT_510809 [Monoraphidium minutum]
MSAEGRDLGAALCAALDAFASPGCGAERAHALLSALAAAAAAAAPGAALRAGHVRRLHLGLAGAASPKQALWLVRAAEVLCSSMVAWCRQRTRNLQPVPWWVVLTQPYTPRRQSRKPRQIAAAPGMAPALAALLCRWPAEACAAAAADLVARFTPPGEPGACPESRAFAAALLAAPCDAAGALLAMAAAAGAARRPRAAAAAPFLALANLLKLECGGGPAVGPPPLSARCHADEPAALAAVALIATGVLSVDQEGGLLAYLWAVPWKGEGAFHAAANSNGFGGAVVAGAMRAGVGSGGGARVALCVYWLGLLEGVVMFGGAAAAAGMAAAPGALAALVRTLGGGQAQLAHTAARTLAAIVVHGSPQAFSALLQLPTLTALTALLRREGVGHLCRRNVCECPSACAVAAALVKHNEAAARTLVTLLVTAPGALSAIAQVLEAAAPSFCLSSGLYNIPWFLNKLLEAAPPCSREPCSRVVLRLALLPAVARALATCLRSDPTPAGQPLADPEGLKADGDRSYATAYLGLALFTMIEWMPLHHEEGGGTAAGAPAGGSGAPQAAAPSPGPRAAAVAEALAVAPGLEAALRRRAQALEQAAEAPQARHSGVRSGESGGDQQADVGDSIATPDWVVKAMATELNCIRSLMRRFAALATVAPGASQAAAAAVAETVPNGTAGGAGGSSGGAGSSRGDGGDDRGGGSGGSGSDRGGTRGTSGSGQGPAKLSCVQCGAAAAPDGGPLKLCRGCRSVRFCSEACLRLAWRAGHKAAWYFIPRSLVCPYRWYIIPGLGCMHTVKYTSGILYRPLWYRYHWYIYRGYTNGNRSSHPVAARARARVTIVTLSRETAARDSGAAAALQTAPQTVPVRAIASTSAVLAGRGRKGSTPVAAGRAGAADDSRFLAVLFAAPPSLLALRTCPQRVSPLVFFIR